MGRAPSLACAVAAVTVLAAVCAWVPAVTAVDTSPIQFSDVAPQAGVRFVLRDSAVGEWRQIEPMVGGVAVFDYNNDGSPDIFFVNGARQPAFDKPDPSYYNRLFRNNRDGTFTDVTLEAGVRGDGFATAVAAADYDNDGFTDLFLAGVDHNLLLHNRGDGTFENLARQAGLDAERGRAHPWSIGAGWFDYDNDGKLDLFVVNYCAWSPETEPPCTIGKSRTYCHPRYYKGLPNALYHNRGNGTFEDVSAASGIASHIGKGMSLAFLDFDRDGRLDVFVANDTVPNFLFRNEGGGKFREMGLEAGVAFNADGRAVSSMGAAAGDLDGDGLEDLFVTANNNEGFPLFRGASGGTFLDATYPSGVGRLSIAFTGWSNGIHDFNNDGRNDLFAACGAIDSNVEEYSHRKSRQANLLLANSGGGRFTDATSVAGAGFGSRSRHRGAAFGDFDLDGKMDVVITRIGEPAELFRNVSPGANQWIGFRLRGTSSNRDGIGAVVRIATASGKRQSVRISTAMGYGSSSDKTAHFGLGSDTKVTAIDILWPSGKRQQLGPAPAGKYINVTEP